MVKVKLIKKNEDVVGFVCKGHANSNEYGKDLICAGVSSIITGGFNAFSKEDIESITLEEGYAEVILKSVECKSKTVLDVIIIQLQTIEESYPKYIKIN